VAGTAGLALITSLIFRLLLAAEAQALTSLDEAQARLRESEERRLRAEFLVHEVVPRP
jgi:hypothetical protein